MKHIGEAIKECNITLDTNELALQSGFTQLPNFNLRHPDMSPGAKIAYALFLSYAWGNNFCFPGQDRLAVDMGMSRSRVTEFVGELQRAGWLTVKRLGLGRTNHYTIHFQVKKLGDKMFKGRPADVQKSARRHQDVGVPTFRGQPADF
jgi:hypothetical protein